MPNSHIDVNITVSAVITGLESSRPRRLRLARRVSSRVIFGGVLLILTSLFTIEGVAQENVPPGKTRNVTTNAGDGKIDLVWQAPSDNGSHPITRYEYESTTTEGPSSWRLLKGTDLHITGATLSSLTNGTSYIIRVRAVSAAGNGDPSDSATATPTIPAPTDLSATPEDGQVRLSWTAVSGVSTITGYQYKRDRETWTSAGTASPYTVTGLTNRTSYSFKIRAVGNGGGGTASASATATPTIPAPTDLSATPEDGQVRLSWTAPSVSTITGYQYKRDSETWASAGTASPYTVTQLTNGTSYTFKVRAVGSGGGGIASNSVHATPEAQPPQTPIEDPQTPIEDPQTPIEDPQTPGNTLPLLETNTVIYETLTVKRVGNPTVTLSWNIPTPFNSQTILEYHYSMDAGQTWTPTSNTDTSITINGDHATTLPRNRFKVRAISLNAEGTARLVIFVLSPYRIYECPVGWVRSDRFGGPTQRVLIYEVNLEMDMSNLISIYKPVWVAIYVHPDEGLQNLEGWKLQVAVPYNHHREYLLTTENSVVVDAGFVEGGFAFIESPEENPFPMVAMGFTGATVPGFDYRLYDDTGRKIDFGIACYKQGGIFQTLKDMEDPRVLRNVLLENLDWDAATYIRSEWTVPTPAPAAPSRVKKTVVGTWAALKKR